MSMWPMDIRNILLNLFVSFVENFLIRQSLFVEIFICRSIYSIRLFFFVQAGNVVTCEMVEELILSGADIVKCGIGPGEFLLSFSSHRL